MRSGRRSSAPALTGLFALLKVGAPLAVIAGLSFWFLNYRSPGFGRLRVVTSAKGAEIYLGGVQTGFTSDTTLRAAVGRQIVTVRKKGYVSDPEFAAIDIPVRARVECYFALRPAQDISERTDSIAPLRPVEPESFSTGQPVRRIPPVARSSRYLVDYSQPSPTGTPRMTPVEERPVPASMISSSGAAQDTGSTIALSNSLIGTEVTVSSDPNGGEIWVNGVATPHSTPYTFRGLDRGVYVLGIRLEGFTSKPESTIVALTHDHQSELLAFELQAQQNLPKPTLTVTTSPLAAAIRVDGRPVGTGKATMDASYGPHRVEFAEVPGYKTPGAVTVRLTEDQPHGEVSGAYERLTGNAFLAVAPSEEVGKFDGSLLRVYVDNELLLDGPKQRFDATLLGKIVAGKRLVKIQYGDLSNTLQVNLLDGEVSEISFRVESFFSKRKLRLKERSSLPIETWQEKTRNLTVFTMS